MGEAEKLAAMTTDARIVEAIKSTDYKYFGDYEMSDGQRDAVDVLVVAARELMKLRTDHLAALRRAKGEGMEELEQKYRKELWLNHGHHGLYGDDREMQCIECLTRKAIEEGE